MSNDQRIQQFRQMAEADPDNELGHFSLGRALLEAGRADEAVAAFERVIALKPEMSKAYQLLGESLDSAGQRGRAEEILTRGVSVADKQGDRMPRDAMAGLLKQWGAGVPVFASSASSAGSMTASDNASQAGFRCARCGRPTGQMPKPPFKGELGQRIFEHSCQPCFREWIPMGTKVINELGLQLSTPAGQAAYDQYMIEFLQIEEV